LIILATLALTSLTFFYKIKADFLQITILFLAIFAALTTISVQKFTSKNLVMTFAHCGFSLIIIGIVLTSSFGLTKEINIKKNESVKIGNYEIKFEKIDYVAGKNFIARRGNFLISNSGASLNPELRYYPESDQTTNEADIKYGFFGDLYLVIGNKDEKENYALRAYFKPFIWLIWCGCDLIFLAALIKIFSLQLKNKKL
jgi:cytochrome c-type biogenesis protein NrfE